MKKDFSRGRSGGFGGQKSFGHGGGWKPGFRGGDSFRPSLHPATCATCGAHCEVPFKPNGKKPIFCKNCFKKDGDAPQRPSYGDRGARPSFGDRGARPSFRERPSFERPTPSQDGLRAQLDEINGKLDAILAAIQE